MQRRGSSQVHLEPVDDAELGHRGDPLGREPVQRHPLGLGLQDALSQVGVDQGADLLAASA